MKSFKDNSFPKVSFCVAINRRTIMRSIGVKQLIFCTNQNLGIWNV
jgi:hypothetical protein